jgi:hypothetical protein
MTPRGFSALSAAIGIAAEPVYFPLCKPGWLCYTLRVAKTVSLCSLVAQW